MGIAAEAGLRVRQMAQSFPPQSLPLLFKAILRPHNTMERERERERERGL